jgi:hypothetical protein
MNGTLDVQDFSSVNLKVEEASEANTMDYGVSFSEAEQPQQKFKSRHFPEPFWGHDD